MNWDAVAFFFFFFLFRFWRLFSELRSEKHNDPNFGKRLETALSSAGRRPTNTSKARKKKKKGLGFRVGRPFDRQYVFFLKMVRILCSAAKLNEHGKCFTISYVQTGDQMCRQVKHVRQRR